MLCASRPQPIVDASLWTAGLHLEDTVVLTLLEVALQQTFMHCCFHDFLFNQSTDAAIL